MINTRKRYYNLPRKTKGLVFILALFFLFSRPAKAQFLTPADSLNKPRVIGLTSSVAVGYSSAMIGLNAMWYKDFPRSNLHFFNDNGAWLQMDKVGHALTSYQLARYGYQSLCWAGLNPSKATWIGGGFSLLMMTSIEVFDGFSSEWGFSPGDMVANLGGTGLFITQHLLWNEQRVALKFSYAPSDYAPYRPELLGGGGLESMLKDYNGQTIWLSVNPSSFSHGDRKLLPWLSIALGYGANGMTGGDFNPAQQSEFAPASFERYRQYYLSLDVDLSKIKTNSQVLKTIFSLIGFIKIPAPALELSQNRLTWHWIQF